MSQQASSVGEEPVSSPRASVRRAGLFEAPGEMAERCRAFDWASTPLGAPETWSSSLRTMADAVLASRNPMLLFWGPELIQFYNDAFRPSLGASTGPEARHPRALGMRAAEFWTDVWAVVGPQIEGVMTRGEAVWFEDLHLPIERDGRLDDAWWTYSYSPVRDDDGCINGTLVVCIETTPSVKARRELEAANRAKADFLAVMSHELRTPLNAIGGYAELMAVGVHGPVSAEQLSALEKIQRSQRHLLGLINGVLNYARIEAGALHYEIEEFALEGILSHCEALTAPQMREKGLVFTSAGSGGALRVRADREKLQQILVNLLANAIKFTDSGGNITIECVRNGGLVAIAVRDSGRGIAADRQESIFQPFVQVDASLTRTSEGVGLGLAISRDLARAMDGDLTVQSVPGEGSTFTLSLPAA